MAGGLVGLPITRKSLSSTRSTKNNATPTTCIGSSSLCDFSGADPGPSPGEPQPYEPVHVLGFAAGARPAGTMCRSASYYHKQRFLRLCRHYIVMRPNSRPMTKECFEAHLIGMVLQARMPAPGSTLGNGQWTKALLQELMPGFTWDSCKVKAAKMSSTMISFVNEPVLMPGLPAAEQHRWICENLQLGSSTLTFAQYQVFHHMGMHSRSQLVQAKAAATATSAASSSAAAANGGASSSALVPAPAAALVVAGAAGRAGAPSLDIPAEVLRMGALVEVAPPQPDAEPPPQPGQRSWLVPMGAPMAAFFVFAGPPEVTHYLWHTKGTKVEESLVIHIPATVRSPRTFTRPHDYLDHFALLPDAVFAAPEKLLYRRDLFCAGRPGRFDSGNVEGVVAPNCMRACGGRGACTPLCQGPASAERQVRARLQ